MASEKLEAGHQGSQQVDLISIRETAQWVEHVLWMENVLEANLATSK